ncbi:2'-5' RNA ligase family protein [Hymenobacter sediminicola]|uniref:2'-5' RNA ligase family protein n=1 Tax=Hymenobacter sediminicola TaxID=2761579 RepID=A0A7G7W2H3_9BACT|nr:2'-5' RNA ligase family protein [Hymenobacter sediminicola]QNH60566.1 2'-5' RNA ligase family protein [Hymenobacter sediminicola]
MRSYTKESAALYLLALLPPEPVRQQVWEMKQELHHRTGSRNAIRLPPHITLLPPMRQPDTFTDEASVVLRDFAALQAPFEVGVQGFNWFGSRTLFVEVRVAEALRQFHAALVAHCARYLPAVPQEPRPFTPHMTLATRDLPADQVPALRQEFAARCYEATFPVSTFELFRHNGQQWVGVETFQLTGQP